MEWALRARRSGVSESRAPLLSLPRDRDQFGWDLEPGSRYRIRSRSRLLANLVVPGCGAALARTRGLRTLSPAVAALNSGAECPFRGTTRGADQDRAGIARHASPGIYQRQHAR